MTRRTLSWRRWHWAWNWTPAKRCNIPVSIYIFNILYMLYMFQWGDHVINQVKSIMWWLRLPSLYLVALVWNIYKNQIQNWKLITCDIEEFDFEMKGMNFLFYLNLSIEYSAKKIMNTFRCTWLQGCSWTSPSLTFLFIYRIAWGLRLALNDDHHEVDDIM